MKSIFNIFLIGITLFYLVISVRNISNYRDLMENYPPEWGNYFTAAEWVRDNTPKDCIVVDRKPRLFRTVSLRKCRYIDFPYIPDSEVIMEFFYSNKIDYVIIPSIRYKSIGTCIVPTVNKYIDKFKLVFYIDKPPTYIFQFNN